LSIMKWIWQDSDSLLLDLIGEVRKIRLKTYLRILN
jgi:hypothetical protein